MDSWAPFHSGFCSSTPAAAKLSARGVLCKDSRTLAADTPGSVPFDPFAGPAIVATAPTTEPQREIWTACALGDDASLAYNESITLALEGSLNIEALRGAFDDVLARHDSLRSTLSADGMTLLVGSAASNALGYVDESGLDAAAQEAARAARAQRAVTTPFDLVNGPLFRAELVKLSDQRHYVTFTAHHIIFDGWSNAVVVSDWGALYGQRLGVAPAPDAAPSFADYARKQAALPPEVGFADEAYWLQRFTGSPTSVDLPSDRLRPPLKTFSSRRRDRHLNSELVSALRRTGASFKASLFATLFGAFNVLVNRLSQQEDLVIGIPAAGQSQGDNGGLVGHCVNMLPIRSSVLRTQPFSELLGSVRSVLLDSQEHQSFTFGKLLTKLPLPRDPSRLPLVSVIFNVDRAQGTDGVVFPELKLRVSSNPRAFENFDLFLNAVEVEGRVELECQYNTDLFDDSTIERWLATYETLLHSITREPTQNVGLLDLVSDADKQQVASWNQTDAAFPRERCVHELVAEVAKNNPDAVACEFQGASLSYGELVQRADAFARKLRGLGVRRGTLVGLCVERGPSLLVGALAIWKAGGAYVPMDPGYPRERLAQMLEDSAAPVLVTQVAVDKELALKGATLAFVEEPVGDIAGVSLTEDAATPDDVAYVIYTSGSTGKPKGVLVPQRAVVNLLSSVAKVPGLTRQDVVLAVTTLSFDIAVSETWLPLTLGAKIVMVSRETASDGGLLREVVEQRAVSFIDATPATYRLLLAAGWTGSPTLKLICTGEAMPLDLAQQLLKSSGSLWNGYGPTETTVWSTFWRVPPTLSRVLIGQPVDNTQIYVLDEQRKPVPVNVPGELFIAGSGVTLGYLNRPELTDERFVEDPFKPGTRMYRTGDVGRWLPSGELECMGRNDNQVKLRGFRIELGEIESALGQHDAVGQVAVIKREDRPGDAKLVGYFVAKGEAPSASVLRQHLKTTLPDYMVPASFVVLDRMPLTPSGKIDRRALPAPEAGPVGSDAEFVAPRTAMEKTMADLWSAMLGVARVGIHDDFFALGGHSLLASQILARLRRDHGVQLSFRKFFEAPTVARLAKEAEAAAGDGGVVQVPLVRRAPGAPVPLSLAQERIALMEQMHPAQQTTHSLPAAWQLTGPVDLSLLQAALDILVQRHETLRTAIAQEGSQLQQKVSPSAKLEIESRDLRSVPAPDRHAKMMEDIRERTQVPFDLSVGPLFRSVLYRLEDEVFVYFTLRHNVIWDGWSYDVFLADLCESYAALAESRASKLPEPPVSYGDYVIWQRETLKGSEIARQRDWWHKELADSPLDLPLPYDFARPTRMSYRGGTILARFSKEQAQALTALGHQANTTLFMALFTAYAVLLHRHTGSNDILVGLPVRGRQLPELENLIGSFTNTIVLRARLNGEESFMDFLKQTRDRALDAFSNEQLPLEMLQIRPPVVRALFSFQDARTRPLGMGGITLKQIDVEPPAAANDLMVWMVERHDHLIAVVNYSTELFTPETIHRLVRSFTTLVDEVVKHPERSLSRLNVVHEQDAQATPQAGAGQAAPLLPELLARQVGERPSAAAVLRGEQTTSYAELDTMSSAVSSALLSAGLQPGSVVALSSPTSAAQVAAVWGIWRAGACLLALDPKAPSELSRKLAQSAGAKLLLHADDVAPLDGMPALPLLTALAAPAQNAPTLPADAAAWLRVLFGADGAATTTRVDHAQLSAAAVGLAQLVGSNGGRLAVGLAPSSDSFALEIALGVAAGLSLALPPPDARLDEVLVDSLAQPGSADVALAAAGAWAELRAAGGKSPPVALVLGDVSKDLATALETNATRAIRLRVLETPGFALLHEAPLAGLPGTLSGTLVGSDAGVVLDGVGQVSPLGVLGDLHLIQGGKAQPSGLRARRLVSGALEVASAASDTLELSGHRFERAAVSRGIELHPAVATTYVAVEQPRGAAGPRLVCYAVPAVGASFTETELRRHARSSLPAALVPHVFVETAELPRDAQGRVDTARLPSPFAVPLAAHIPPRTPSEQLLARLFMEVLGVPRVGVHDNFFDLGGQSLLCLRVIDMIERETRRRMSPRILLLNTVGQAASALDQLQGGAPSAEAAPKKAEETGVAGRVLKGLRGLLGG